MILAISGSLRRASVNSAALRAAATAAAQAGLVVTVDDTVRELPHFDPDLEGAPPEAVVRFRAACDAASGVLLSVPEYALGIPGAFKNALDWTVGSTCLYLKPVTVLDVAPLGRGESVRTALGRVLQALNTDAVFRSVPITSYDRDVAGEIIDPGIVKKLCAIVGDLDDRATAAASLRSRSARDEAFAR
jgi:chromate reductase, NAD(P)H dehydrogenase (quinone)